MTKNNMNFEKINFKKSLISAALEKTIEYKNVFSKKDIVYSDTIVSVCSKKYKSPIFTCSADVARLYFSIKYSKKLSKRQKKIFWRVVKENATIRYAKIYDLSVGYNILDYLVSRLNKK